ncbi:class I glutamine amidotransferase-like protein [Mycena galericulata]|nr:class I glutamine amidotransferase-like protein [Mycena galericulata]
MKSIALLVCDTPSPPIRAAHGDYPAMFTALLRDAQRGAAPRSKEGVVELDPEEEDSEKERGWRLDAYDVVHAMAYPTAAQLAGYDGVIITGSKASAYEDVEWVDRLVGWVASVAVDPGVKIVGICFGHQIVARALGGRCVPNGTTWEVGPTRVALTPLGREVFGVEGAELYIEEMHRDHVPEVPPSFHLLGSTDVTMNQGMVRFVPGFDAPAALISGSDSDSASPSPSPESPTHIPLSAIQILTVQGHPEFSDPIVSALTDARTQAGIIDGVTAADAVQRLGAGWRNDGVRVVGRAILGVLGVA